MALVIPDGSNQQSITTREVGTASAPHLPPPGQIIISCQDGEAFPLRTQINTLADWKPKRKLVPVCEGTQQEQQKL